MGLNCENALIFVILTGYHRDINILLGEQTNVWVLVDKILDLEVSFKNELDTIGVGQSSRIISKKQQATEKAMRSAFASFNKDQDVLKLVRFGTYKCAKLGIEPVAAASNR